MNPFSVNMADGGSSEPEIGREEAKMQPALQEDVDRETEEDVYEVEKIVGMCTSKVWQARSRRGFVLKLKLSMLPSWQMSMNLEWLLFLGNWATSVSGTK